MLTSALKLFFKGKVSSSVPSFCRSYSRMTSETYPTVSYVTAPNEVVARQLSRLAACVNIVRGVESVYEWQGKIEEDSEMLMVIKSTSQKSEDLVRFIQDNHPYDCPEVVTLKVESGSKSYLEWINSTVSKDPIMTDSSLESDVKK